MRCRNCPFYESGQSSNTCKLTQSDNFYMQNDCNLVFEDGTVNKRALDEVGF